MDFKQYILERYPKTKKNSVGKRSTNTISIEQLLFEYSRFEEKFKTPGIVEGCQCKDRPGETTVWCCNTCGLPCEAGWLPAKKFIKPDNGTEPTEESPDGGGSNNKVINMQERELQKLYAKILKRGE